MTVRLLLLAFIAGSASAQEPVLRLHAPRFGAAAAAIGNRVYVTGGWGETGALDTIEEIDIEQGTVTLLPVRIEPRHFHASATWRDQIVLVGGRSDQSGFAALELFHPPSGRLTPLPPLPRPRSAPAAAVAGDRLYVVGGQDSLGRRRGYVDIFDFAMRTWRRGADMPTARECAVALVGNSLYALGGYDGFGPLAIVERFDLETETWSGAPPLAAPQSGHRALADDNTVYLFGDYLTRTRVAAGDPASGDWRLLELHFQPSRHNAAARVGDRFVVAGGNTQPDPPYLDAIQVFTRAALQQAPTRPAPPAARESPRPDAEAARHVIDQATRLLQTASNAVIRGLWEWSYRVQGTTWTARAPYELVLDRQNRMYLDFDPVRVWCDGTTYVQENTRNGQRREVQATEDLDILLNRNNSARIPAAMPPGHGALLSTHRALEFRHTCHAQRLAREEDTTWNGRTAHRMALFSTNRADQKVQPDYRITIDSESGLTVAVESLPSDERPHASSTEAHQFDQIMSSLQYRFRAHEARVNTEIDPACFRAPPPSRPTRATGPNEHPLSLSHIQQHITWQRYREDGETIIAAPLQRQWVNPLGLDFVKPAGGSYLLNRLPATHEVLVADGALAVIRLADGTEECRIPYAGASPHLPAAGGWKLAWMPGPRPADDLVVISEDERLLRALDRAGQERWRVAGQHGSLEWLLSLPAGPGRASLLAAGDYRACRFYDAEGQSLGHITLHPANSVELADRDADGWVELTVFGLRTTRYEWLPTPP